MPLPRRLVLLLTASLLALPATSLAQVKVGFVNSITGPEAPIGENLTHGVDLALEDLAAKGVKLTLVRQDDTGKTPVAMSAMVASSVDGKRVFMAGGLVPPKEPVTPDARNTPLG